MSARYYVWAPRGAVYHDELGLSCDCIVAACDADLRGGPRGGSWPGWKRGTEPPENRDLCKRCRKLRRKVAK